MLLTKQIDTLIDHYNYRMNKISDSSPFNNEAFERGFDAGYMQALTTVKYDLIQLKEFEIRKNDRLSFINENDDDDI